MRSGQSPIYSSWKKPVLLTAMSLILCIPGCTTGRVDSSKYVRDGHQYGITDSTRFRGRWWSYYERGRSYSAGGSWEEAERDIKIALIKRSTDQRWARTYGLHFMPEYFPHREMGIVMYGQGRIEEAERELEYSYNQEPSARAGYYLDKVRTDRITANNEDSAPPTLEIVSPKPGQPFSQIQTELVAVAHDDTYVGKIEIDGNAFPIQVSKKDIEFSWPITLSPGVNEFEIALTDLSGKTTRETIAFNSDVDGPAVSFDSPVNVPGHIAGVVYDPAGVDTMSITGIDISLTDTGDNVYSFAADISSEMLNPPLTYEVKDRLGNITQSTIPVDSVLTSGLISDIVLASDTRPKVIPLNNNLLALTMGGQILAVTKAATGDPSGTPPKLAMNLSEGQRYLMDEINVQLKIESESDITEAEIMGHELQTIPGRKKQTLSRRIPLEAGENIILASVKNADALATEESVKIARELPEYETPDNKLSLAMIEETWRNAGTLDDNTIVGLVSQLQSNLTRSGRFRLVDRAQFEDVLLEQEISTKLSSRKDRIEIGQMMTADVFVSATVSDDLESVTIITNVTSSETGEIITNVDVTRPKGELREAIEELGLLLVQEFPRKPGKVVRVTSADSAISMLCEADRIKTSMKCTFFKYGEDIIVDGMNFGKPVDILSDGRFIQIQAKMSKAKVSQSAAQDATGPVNLTTVTEEIWIVPK